MRTIFLIRHAEKPDEPKKASDGRPQKAPDGKTQEYQAVNETGVLDKEALTVRGWQRAGALTVFFGSKKGLPAPRRIYASAAEKEKVAPKVKFGSDSERPALTVTPLAAKLGLDVIRKFTKDEELDLAAEITKKKGITLVSWQHEAIPEIAKNILRSAVGIPDPWPADRFDVVWRFVRTEKRGGWKFDQVCQNLLADDKPQPIPVKPKPPQDRARRRPR